MGKEAPSARPPSSRVSSPRPQGPPRVFSPSQVGAGTRKADARVSELGGYRDVAWQPSQVKQELLGEDARWADEIKVAQSQSSVTRAASIVKRSVCWRALLASTVVFDVAACVVYRSSALGSDDVGAACWYVVEASICAIMVVDLFVRTLAVGHGKPCGLGFALDTSLLVVMVVCSFCDLLIVWQLPFAVHYLLRNIIQCRQYFDHFVDAAVDRKLMQALGDIFFISPDNATARPSDGFFVVEKTHIRPEAFADIHAPVTVKGGFVELVYIDLDIGSRGSRRAQGKPPRPEQPVEPLASTPEEDAEDAEGAESAESDSASSQDLESGVAARKVSKVCVELHNLLLVLGPSKSLGKQAWTVEDVCESKDRLVQIIAHRTEMLVGGRKKQEPPSSQKWQPRPTTVLGKLRHYLQQGPLSRLDLSHVSVDIQNVEVRFEDFALLPKPMSCGLHLANMSMKLDVTHATVLRTREFRAFPGWLHERRLGGEYGGHSVDTDNDNKRPPVRIACCCQPMVAWCDLGTSSREVFKRESFTHLFSAEKPEFSTLVRTFKRKGAVRKFKLAAVSALHLADSGDRDYPRRDIQEKILDHRFVLLPLVASFHAMTVDSQARVLTHEGELGHHPEQVSDLDVSQIAVQLDRDQAANLTALVRLIDDWIKTDAWISRKPPIRIARTAVRFQHKVVQDWWVFAVREVACSIAPKGRLDTFLGARRKTHYGEAYQQLIYERHCAVAARGQQRSVLDVYDKQTRHLQLVLPVGEIIRRRNAAKRWYVNGAQQFHWNPDLVRSLTTTSSSIADHVADELSDGILRAKKTAHTMLIHESKSSKSVKAQATRSKSALESPSLNKAHSGFLWKRFGSTSTLNKVMVKANSTESDTAAPLTTAQKSLQERRRYGEPAQVWIRVGRISVVMLEPLGDAGIRKELVRWRMRGASLVWTRSAPKEHFRQFQSKPARVLDHMDDGALSLQPGFHPAASSMIATAGLTSLLGPSEGLEEGGSGWQTLEVSVSFFSVIYCRAPSDVPNLRKLVVRRRVAGTRMAAGGRRAVFQEGGTMVRLRAVFHSERGRSEEEHSPPHESSTTGEPRAVVVVHCCALRIVHYEPLVDVVLSAIKLPPARAWEDPLQLGDIRRRLKDLRMSRNSLESSIRAFEKLSGVKGATGQGSGSHLRRPSLSTHPDSGRRCLAVTAGVDGVSIRRFTANHYLVQHFSLPAGRQVLQRQSSPPYFSLGGSFEQPEEEGVQGDWEDMEGGEFNTDEVRPVKRQGTFAQKILKGINTLKRTMVKIEEEEMNEQPEQGDHCFWCKAAAPCRSRVEPMQTATTVPSLSFVARPSEEPSQLVDPASCVDVGWPLRGPEMPETGKLQVELKVLKWREALEEL